MFVKANGIQFHCQIDGEPGLPWLMFSNSLATNLTMWDDQAAQFSGSYRVLRYDQRGHGETDAPEGDYTFDLLIADALALMDALEIDRTSFCGVSMGGATAMGLALRHPDRIERAIVCDSPCVSTPAGAKAWEERIAIARSEGMDGLVQSTTERWFSKATLAANPPHLDKVRQMIRTTPVNGFVGCSTALSDHDFRTDAGSVARPVLFICGGDDAPALGGMRDLQGAVAGARLVEIPGAGHIVNMDQPDLFNPAVADFLRQ